MPKKKVPGRERLDLRAPPRVLDLATQAGQVSGMDLSTYVRLALVEKLQRDGFIQSVVELLPVKVDKPKRPRGRPKKSG